MACNDFVADKTCIPALQGYELVAPVQNSLKLVVLLLAVLCYYYGRLEM